MYRASHVALARTLITEYGPQLEALPGALRSRAAIASIPHIPAVRDHRAPNYGSDLGVRRSDDPGVFLEAALQSIGVDPTAHRTQWDSGEIEEAWASGRLGAAELTAALDTLISFAGMWEAAAALGRQLLAGSRAIETYRLRTYVAAALSSVADPAAGNLFHQAITCIDSTPATSAMSRIRLAAWLVKRQRDIPAGVAVLDEFEHVLSVGVDGFALTRGDRRALLGVAGNLRALTASMGGEPERAMQLLTAARADLETGGLVVVGDDERRRYLAQVTINIAQLQAGAGDIDVASQTMDQHVDWVRQNHRGSLSEALALGGYVHYLAERYERAVPLLLEAHALIIDEGAPKRLAIARKNLAAALHFSGQTAEAEDVLESIEADPAGIKHYRRVAA